MQRNGTAAESTLPAASTDSQGSTASPGASDQQQTPQESTPASDDSQTQRSGNDWFRQAFNARRYGVSDTASQPEAPAAGESGPESDDTRGDTTKVRTSAEDGAGPKPREATEQATPEQRRDTLQLTPEEFQRRVQAETDRRLDKFQREEAERRKRDERRKLRENDPYAYAQAEREDEAKSEALQRELANAHRMTLSTVETYDKSVLDPLIKAVPAEERKKILQSIEPGLVGRGQAATQALKILERTWKEAGVAEARQRLMNDQSFVKEVLARHAGVRQELTHIPAAAAPAGQGFNVNDSLRMAARQIRGRS